MTGPTAFNCKIIIAGIRVSGIYPMDRNIFREDEFLSAFVTDRPEPVDEQPHATGINVAPGVILQEHNEDDILEIKYLVQKPTKTKSDICSSSLKRIILIKLTSWTSI